MSFACRLCQAPLTRSFIDLGSMPLANDYPASSDAVQPSYALHAWVCDICFLVQVHHPVPPQNIFSDYAYFSSFSSSWLVHAHHFAERMISELKLGPHSHVVEIASNDGYLLKNFVAAGIPCLGLEPAENVAAAALSIGVPTEIAFLDENSSRRLAANGQTADLLIANNVIAHVPDLNGFIASLARLLRPQGVLSIECPHLLHLIGSKAFDTIYHEHFSYFSLLALEKALSMHGLRIFAVEQIPTHGGSLRILCCHHNSDRQTVTLFNPSDVLALERRARLHEAEGYSHFAGEVRTLCQQFVHFLNDERAKGHRIAAYGAAAKGNTFLNACGITSAQINFVADLNPTKQGKFLPGSKIPIYAPEKILAEKPDLLLILPWNIAGEICAQMQAVKTWGGHFVTAIPALKIW